MNVADAAPTSVVHEVVQICPQIGPGTGVGGVAHHLEEEFRSLGLRTHRVTLREAHGQWTLRIGGRLGTVVQVVWFSTVGTSVARRRLKELPDAVSICHNDALAGDVYVNHGILRVAMRARGHHLLRMVRNPLHLFTAARDHYRYSRSTCHSAVVSLGTQERDLLAATYPRLRQHQHIIGNGVDLARFHVPSPAERGAARAELNLTDGDFLVLFVGHEFERKGLPHLVDAVAAMPESSHVLVVGGSSGTIAALRERPSAEALGARLHFVGVQADPQPFFAAADVLALPSAYEAFPLVVLEAMASGLPVVATAAGSVADIVSDGVNGWITSRDADGIRRALSAVMNGDRATLSGAARKEAERHSWSDVGRRYLLLLADINNHRAAR